MHYLYRFESYIYVHLRAKSAATSQYSYGCVPVRREVISGNCCSRAFARLAVWYAALRKPRGSVRTPSNPKGPGQRVPLLGKEHARGRTGARGSAEAGGIPQSPPLRRPAPFVRCHAHEAAVPESSPRRARALVRSRPRAHRIARAGRRRPRRGARRVLEACGEGRQQCAPEGSA